MNSESSVAISKELFTADAARVAETRAFFVPVGGKLSDRDSRDIIEEQAARGCNTAIIPLMHDGEMTLHRQKTGERVVEDSTLESLVRTSFVERLSTWLSLDFISAGAPGAKRPCAIARRHPSWLMRGPRRQIAPLGTENLPGMFCWMDSAYRRYVGRALVAAIEALPVEAVVLDLRRIPTLPADVMKWPIFGAASLRHLVEELEVEPDEIPEDADEERMADIERLRLKGLEYFVEQLRALASATRPDIPFIALVANKISPDGDIYMPYLRWTQTGMISEVILSGPPSKARMQFREIDASAARPVPILALGAAEADLEKELHEWLDLPVTGWVVHHPKSESNLPALDLGAAPWSRYGCVETHPRDAALVHSALLRKEFSGVDAVESALIELEQRLAITDITPAELDFLRDSLESLLSRLRDGSAPMPELLRPRLVALDRLTRLLSMVPIPVIIP